MDSSLKKRIITSVICIPLLILILLSPKLIFSVVVVIASIIGLYEYFKATGLLKYPVLCIMGYLATIVIAFGANFSSTVTVILVYAYVVVLFVIMITTKNGMTVKHIGLLMFGLVYIPYFLSHIIYIRDMEFGKFLIWLVLIGACMTDTSAYFFGKALGRHKLCPIISPNKTVEGAIGGIFGGGLSFMLFGVIVNAFFGQYLDGKRFDLILLFALGIAAAVASEIGDLAASAIKRQFGIKDFGNILPGHGGILDRCDSIILVAPTVFLFVYNINILV